jgi:hypothetical protein
MATWKKLVVSGSNVSQLNNDANYLVSGDSGIQLSGSFSGSFEGDGSGLTGVVATNAFALTDGNGIVDFSYDGSVGATVTVEADGTTLSVGAGGVKVADAGITATQLNTSVAGDGLAGGAGTALSVNVDDSSIEINSDSLRIKASGVTSNELATSVAGDGLAGGGGSALSVNVDDSTIEINTDTLRVKAGGITTNEIADSLGTIGQNSFTGSFSGSFTGDVDIDLADLTQGTGITTFSYDGNSAQTVSIKNADNLTSNVISKWDDGNGQFTDSSLTDNGTNITGTTSIRLSGAASSLTGSFTGSFFGDGSGLTGVATDLTIDADSGGTSTVDLLTQTLDIAGGTNINTSVSGQTITVNLDSNISVTDATVSGDLIVLGTASFQNTENLQVADRFILLASGSNSTGDGGFVVQQATQDVGELFGYDSGTTRWAVDSAFNASTGAFTPEAFMAAVVEGAGTDPDAAPARYDAKGNIFVGTDEAIWIYS